MISIKKQRPLHWTSHCRYKMRFYGLSESRVKRVISFPKRIEEGIAPDTIAMMQSAGTEKHPYEIWLMIQEEKTRRKIISAWRYPGKTKPGQALPAEIIKEMKSFI